MSPDVVLEFLQNGFKARLKPETLRQHVAALDSMLSVGADFTFF